MTSIDLDLSQVTDLESKLADTGKVVKAAQAVIAKGALNIKNDLRKEATGSGGAEFASLARFITYATRPTLTGVTAEIGPTEGASGSFAFAYFGNSKNGPMLPDPVNALNREASNVEKFMLDAIEGIL